MLAILPAVLGMLRGGSGGSSGTGGANGLQQLVGGSHAQGLGDIASSWVGAGPNKAITTDQVKAGLGPDTISQIASQRGLPEEDVAKHLSSLLPGLVNHLTPNGTMPDAASLNQALQGLQGVLPTK
jgi:uncharacterized protein YidB (DUF937 family)